MPEYMRNRIRTEYKTIRTLEGTQNPVVKRLVHVLGDAAQVYMEDAEEEPAQAAGQDTEAPAIVTPGNQPANRPRNVNGQQGRQLLLSVLAGQNNLRRAIVEQGNSLEMCRASLQRHDRTVNRLIRRIDNSPVRLLANANRQVPSPRRLNPASPQRINQRDNGLDPHAILAPTLRTLNQVWDEWIRGVGNNKAARYFTAAEQGRCKFKYSRRKIVWSIIEARVRANDDPGTVIQRIYDLCGHNKSVTAIIKSLRTHKAQGTLPLHLRA